MISALHNFITTIFFSERFDTVPDALSSHDQRFKILRILSRPHSEIIENPNPTPNRNYQLAQCRDCTACQIPGREVQSYDAAIHIYSFTAIATNLNWYLIRQTRVGTT